MDFWGVTCSRRFKCERKLLLSFKKQTLGKLLVKTNPKVEHRFADYPVRVREKMQYLRSLVLETAEENEGIEQLEEALKWGEPSFVTKIGSTLRMDWKEKSPNQYAQCISSAQVDWQTPLNWCLTISFSTRETAQLCLS